MPRRVFAPRGGVRTAVRRRTAWGVGPEGELAHTTSVAQLFSIGSAATLEGSTVVRIRGEFMAFLTSVDAAGAGFRGAVGIGLTTVEAFTAGIASVPTPLSDDDAEIWLWHSFFHVLALGTDTNSLAGAPANVRLVIDSKAMRKEDFGTVLFGAVEVVESGVAVAESSLLSRVLVKLA